MNLRAARAGHVRARAMGDCFDGLSEKVGEGIKKKEE